MIKQRNNNSKGFTILETLVAISILLISIVGPLTVAEKGLVAASTAQDQMTATYLAEDLLEFVRDVRDNYIVANNSSWLAGSVDLSSCNTVNSKCDFDTKVQSPSAPVFATCNVTALNLCTLYLAPSGSINYYTPDSTLNATSSRFSRSFTITPLNESVAGNAETAASAVITVNVAWKTGGISNEVVLQDVIFNTLR